MGDHQYKRRCLEPDCVDGYVHEDGEVSTCWTCSRRDDVEHAISGIEFMDRSELAATFPNRRAFRAALGGRSTRASYLIDRHEDRSMSRVFGESEDEVRAGLASHGLDYDQVAEEGLAFMESLLGDGR